MKLIIPPHYKTSVPVQKWSEIKADALAMVHRIEAGKFDGGLWKEAYALSHSQVSHFPRSFFVVNWKIAEVKKAFRYSIIINPEITRRDSFVLFEEACMSEPWRKPKKKKRYSLITVSYSVPGWFGCLKKITETHVGLPSYISQHELEHFRGIY